MSAAPGRPQQARSEGAAEGPPVNALAYRIDGKLATPEAFYALACDPARSIAVEACAGAGKTWMLVSRVLRALLDGAEPQDILAITFTKKAAGEMRARLQQELLRWAGLSDAELLDALTTRGMSPDAARLRLADARGLHARVQASGRTVQLRTFHSWFAALLRGAPLSVLQELRLPPQYELQEDDQPVLQRVWPRFYARVQGDAAAREDFFASVARVGRHQTLQALDKAAARRVEFTLADAAGVVDRSVARLVEAFPDLQGFDSPAQWLLTSPQVRAVLQDAAIALGRAPQKSFSARGVQLEKALTEGKPDDVVDALLTKATLEPRKFNDTLLGIEAIPEAQGIALQFLQAERQQSAWDHHQRMARLTRILLASYADLKHERGWVDMNDVEGAARRLLADAELSGWLQQRLDARVRHLLIDEFQDTNPLQWQALYGWLSGYAGAGPGEAPGVFLVGDPKQSIYRFRRAEPQVFKAAQAYVVNGLGGALLSCDHTRRCAPAVIEAVNAAMEQAVQAGEYGAVVGAEFRAHTTGSTHHGAVLALPQVPRSARATADVDTETWRDSLHTPRHESEDTYSAMEARQAADWIAGEIEAGRVRPQDVMVLARKRERLGWLHDALLERGIASEQPEKLDLCDAPVVQDMVALMDALVSPTHDLSLARALRSPVLGWTDADLADLARERQRRATRDEPCSWWQALQAQSAAPEAAALWRQTAERLLRWRGLLLGLPPHDALSAIVREGEVMARYAQAVPPSQRQATLAQLRELLAQSLALEGGRFLTAYRFVRALRAGGLASTPVATPDAVRLLTIHGAKGLEAPTVLLLDTDGPPARPESMGVLIDWPGEDTVPRRFVFLASEKNAPSCAREALAVEQRARSLEELNALYVALTRAESRLVFSSFEPHKRGQGTSWWQRLLPLATPLAVPPAAHTFEGQAPTPFDLTGLPALTAIPSTPDPGNAPQAAGTAGPAEADDATRVGLAMHRLLQWCPTPATDFDWTQDHLQAVAREFDLSPALIRESLDGARRAVAGEAAWAWDAQRLDHWGNEVELMHQGRLLRLDRLVRERTSGTWWVLDFKRHDAPDRDPAYREQMRGYLAALRAIHPGAPVRLAFVTARGRFIELPADTLTA